MISVFFFNDTATTEIYTLSLHDALPISHQGAQSGSGHEGRIAGRQGERGRGPVPHRPEEPRRSEEHTSELQSPCNLVCRLLLEKKKETLSPSWPKMSILASISAFTATLR